MPPLTINQVATGRDLKSFVNFPWKLYKGDKHWIAPLLIDIKSRLNLNRGLLRKGQAALFLAQRGKEVVGRTSASYLKGKLQATGEGNFGFYEMIDDLDVARALMDRAMGWLKERGAKTVIGPYSFLLEDPYPGFLADSFDRPPYFLMTYSKPYYLDHMKALGFEKVQDLHTYEVSKEVPLPQRLLDKAKEAESIPGLRLRSANRRKPSEETEIIRGIFNEALKGNWGFVPLGHEHARNLVRFMQVFGDERLILIAEIDGKPVGVVINFPNFNEPLANCNGRLFLKGALRILFRRRSIRSARNYAMAILPEHQHRGLGSLLIRESFRRGINVGYCRGEIGWILESNIEMDDLTQLATGRNRKCYRIFKKDI